MAALEIKDLRKRYSSGVEALKGISLAIPEGSFYAVLGPNGAGKSTTIGIVTSLIRKTGGTVKAFGHDLDTDPDAVKRLIGVVPQEFNFSFFEPVMQIVITQAGYYGIDRHTAIARAEQYLKMLDLWDKRNTAARSLSGGMKRRLMIARALIHHPKLLILDEPTASVDIEIRHSMWKVLRKMNAEGLTIILTTHYLEEVETLCDRVAIINKGSIIEDCSIKDLLGRLSKETFVLYCRHKPPSDLHLSEVLFHVNGNMIEATVPKTMALNSLFTYLQGRNIEIDSMQNKVNKVEELFLQILNKEKL